MNLNEINPNKMEALLNIVGKKLGMSPEQLKNEIQQGKFDNALKNMKPQDAAAFNQFINNPAMVDKFLNTPQAQALYNKLSGGQ
jgi:hypothetical protein